jgi:hypothetical protein
MATFSTKINPLHFPSLFSDFGFKTNEEAAQECQRLGLEFVQYWSEEDTLTMYFSDSDSFFPLEGRLVDQKSGQIWDIGPDQNISTDYWFDIDLSAYRGRRLKFQAGRFIGPDFVADYESNEFEVLPRTDSRLDCSTLIQYWGCSTDFGWNWNTDDPATVPVYVPTIRIMDSIRQRLPLIQKTVSETYDKSYSICGAEADFLMSVRLEFSPLWYHEKLSLISLQRFFYVDTARYVQELEVQPGEQYRNLPFFKGELVIRKADQVTLMRLACC